MAVGSRTLKLSILADVDDLKKKLGEADKAVENNSSKIADFGKKAAAAFAVAAAAALVYAGKLAVDGVKSAIEDEQAQLRLANALQAATGATNEQIAATEDYISKTQLATGVADNDLRNAFQRLSVTTKDVNKSQSLLNLALDISKGSGKDLNTIVEALSKSYEGQDTRLARLGIGLSAADLKAMDFTETTKALSNLYGGAAAANAETFQGRLDRLKQAFEETKETIGYALLPILETLLGYITTFIIPLFDRMRDAFAGENGFGGSMSQVISIIRSVAIPVFDAMKVAFDEIRKTVDENKEGLQDFIDIAKALAPIFGTVLVEGIKIAVSQISILIDVLSNVGSIIKEILNGVINQINLIIRGINLIKPGGDIGYVSNIGTATASTSSYRSDERGLPTISTATSKTQPTVVNNITVQAVDSEGAARAVTKVINQSSSRSVPQLYNSGITRAR
jgi:hypothetical protein